MAQLDAGETRIVIDFSKTDYMSSAGLRVILKTATLLQEKGGGFALCNGNEQIVEVLEISGFLEIVNYFSSLEVCNGNEQIVEVLEISGFLEIVNYFSSLEGAVTAVSD